MKSLIIVITIISCRAVDPVEGIIQVYSSPQGGVTYFLKDDAYNIVIYW